VTRAHAARGPDRKATCAEAKHTAIAQAKCAQQRSVEGDCDCHQIDASGEWLCAAVMAITCD